ncbi:MAG: hypothetical protein EOP49_16540, partial [Sphingobacteriales bacterium]
MYNIKQVAMLGMAACSMASAAAQAQRGCQASLYFRVLEDKTNQPVPAAVIGTGTQQTVSDEDGYGRVDSLCPGKVHLHVAGMGYAMLDKDFSFAAGDTLTLVLKPSDLTLDAIEIYGHKQALNTTTSVTTLHQEELDRLKGGNLATILSTIPGVNMLQTGATIGKPVVNGMHS